MQIENIIDELRMVGASRDWAMFDSCLEKWIANLETEEKPEKLEKPEKPREKCPSCFKEMLKASLKSHSKICKADGKVKPVKEVGSVITLTFGDMAENHVGMEQIGKMVESGEGFHLNDLRSIREQMREKGAVTELVSLSEEIPAYVLIIRDGIDVLVPGSKEKMFEEHTRLEHDKKAIMYGKVVNKHARWNLCYDEESREPDYENGKGRIVGYDEVPLTKRLKEQIELFGEKSQNLKIEGNYYYDVRKCGIGFHGDGERRKVIGVRLGTASLPLHFQWYYQNKPIEERIVLNLNPGDIYIMSEIAVGTNWKKKNIKTVRHGTGDKYVL